MKFVEKFMVNRDSVRDIYTYKGYEIAHTTTVPPAMWYLSHICNEAVEYNHIILDNKFNKEIIGEFGGYIETQWYTDEGFGHVAFNSRADTAKHEDVLTTIQEFIDEGLFEKLETGDL